MQQKLHIHAAAALTPRGDLDQLWQLWLQEAPGPPSAIEHPDEWQTQTNAVAERIAAGLSADDLSSTGLILATTKGDIERQVAWMRAADAPPPSPSFPALPTLASEATRLAADARIAGPVHAVSTACTSGITAIIDAAVSLHTGDANHMIVLGGDQATSFVHDGFSALKALSPTTCKPFDIARDGLAVSSAAAALLLSLNPARDRAASPPAIINGYAVTTDAVHMTAPDSQANGLISAIHQALAMAHLNPAAIDVLLAHATGTRYNDAMEAIAIQKVFQQNGDKGPAVTAVKSLVGHTLGASALLETALACKILQHQIIPAIHQLTHPEFHDIDFVTHPRPAKIRHVLKTAAGFGGFNAAIILSAPT